MVDYAAVARKCKTGLAKAGISVTLRRTTRGTFSTTTGAFTGDVVTDYAVVALMIPQRIYFSGQVGLTFGDILVRTDDQVLLMAADGLAIVPTAGDQVVVKGTAFSIVAMIPIRPGGTDLMYRILARK